MSISDLQELIKSKSLNLLEQYLESSIKKQKCPYCGSLDGVYADESTGGWLACKNCGGI